MIKASTLNVLLNSITAIGTLGAVIVSLWLARQDRRIYLDAFADRFTGINPEKLDNSVPADVLKISITNTGIRHVTIISVCWELGFLNKIRAIQLYDMSHPFNTRLPKVIDDGETINILLPWKLFCEVTLPNLIGSIKSKIFWKHPYFFKLLIYTSISRRPYKVPVGKGIRQEFMNLMKDIGKKEA
jgi:hypothetical protein